MEFELTSVFSTQKEHERLLVQNELMQQYERPIFRALFDGRSGLNVLDIGCNNGEKTIQTFSDPAVERVIGLEYSPVLAAQADERCCDSRFVFYPCDADAPEFADTLAQRMAQNAVDRFDIVYLSFLLSHLTKQERLLRILRSVLRPDGTLIVVETDDSRCVLTPDPAGRLGAFLDILAEEPFSGDRSTGRRLPEMLRSCGYADVTLRCDAIAAGPGEEVKKAQIYEMFFSYLPDDVAILRETAAANVPAAQWTQWMEREFSALKETLLEPRSAVSMGMALVTARPATESETALERS